MKAFNLRGTNGTGKTFIARKLLEVSGAVPYGRWMTKTKPSMYKGFYNFMPLYILGSYKTTCGGCDTIPKVAIVAEMLEDLMEEDDEKGLVFYEGLLISHSIGTVGQMAKKFNDHHVMGFMDTPLKACINRVERRRKERGDYRLFDPTNVIGDHAAVAKAKVNAQKQGFNVTTIRWDHAEEDVMGWVRYLTDNNTAPLSSVDTTTLSAATGG